MGRFRLLLIALGLFTLQGRVVMAQSTIDALNEELKTVKQQHQDMTSQVMTNFFSQVDAAMSSPDAASALYQQAGGPMPDPSPIVTVHDTESATEKETRLALDQAVVSKLGILLQLHCGLMHFGAIFAVDPNRTGLHDQWVTWLQQAATLYPQLAIVPENSGQPAPDQPRKRKRERESEAGGGGGGATPADAPVQHLSWGELKARAIQDSIITKYLGFKSWGAGDQGGWSVKGIPALYRTVVLDPSRTTPTAATLTYWDTYIAMLNADEKDNDKWNQVTNPPLQYGRACDDYAIAPSTEKLDGLIKLVSANPTYPDVDTWIANIHQLIADYAAKHGVASPDGQAPTAAAPATNSGPVVTTEQQGDATIITTHPNTNASASNPPAAH